MHRHSWILLISVLVIAVAAFLALRLHGRLKAQMGRSFDREVRAEIESRWAAHQAPWSDLAAELITSVATIEQLTQQLLDTDRLRAEYERRANEYRSTNEGILNERNQWVKIHTEETAAHGNAQAVMMDAIHFLASKLQRAGVAFELPAIIQETQQLYIERYIEPVIKRTGMSVVRKTASGIVSENQEKTEEVAVDV